MMFFRWKIILLIGTKTKLSTGIRVNIYEALSSWDRIHTTVWANTYSTHKISKEWQKSQIYLYNKQFWQECFPFIVNAIS